VEFRAKLTKTLVSQMRIYAASGERPCTSCGTVKPFSAFAKSARERLGVRSCCRECTSRFAAARRDPAKELERSRERYRRDPSTAAARLQRWRQANRERVRERDNAYRAANPDKVRRTAKRHYERVKGNPAYRLKAAIKAGIHSRLTKGKSGVSTFDALGYSLDDLKSALEARFQPGMTWENYGKGGWEIDHIFPLSALPCNSIHDPNFRRVWALSNLRPLWASENRSKGASIIAPLPKD